MVLRRELEWQSQGWKRIDRSLAGGLLAVALLGSIVLRPGPGEDADVDYWRIRRR